MKVDEIYQHMGRDIRIIGVDEDPSCDILAVYVDDPDTLVRIREI